MDTFFTTIWVWIYNPAHLLEIGTVGTIAGQLALKLPDSFKGKAQLVRWLHGIFPSPQVFVSGASNVLTSLEKLAPTLEAILEVLENGPTVAPEAETSGAVPPVVIQIEKK